MLRDMVDFFLEVMLPSAIVILFALVVVFVPFFFLGYYGDKASCAAKAEKMQVPHVYSLWEDCMVQIDDRWIPLNSYKVVRQQKQ